MLTIKNTALSVGCIKYVFFAFIIQDAKIFFFAKNVFQIVPLSNTPSTHISAHIMLTLFVCCQLFYFFVTNRWHNTGYVYTIHTYIE